MKRRVGNRKMSEKCPLCGVSFSKIGSLRRHLTTVHKIKYEEHSKYSEEIKAIEKEKRKEVLRKKKGWIDFGINESSMSFTGTFREFAYEQITEDEVIETVRRHLKFLRAKIEDEKRLWNITSDDIKEIRENFNIRFY